MILDMASNSLNCVIILVTLDVIVSLPLIDKDITAINCTLKPAGVNIACTQYLINNTYCQEDELIKKFPELYTLNGDVEWPGEPRLEKQIGSLITWRTPSDVGVKFLKGFQVLLIGNSMESFNTFLCTIIDLSNTSEDESKTLLINTTFSVHFDTPGSYIADVQSLPLTPPQYQPTGGSIQISASSQYKEYHPKLAVSIDYKQTNASCINMTIEIQPELEDIDELYLEVVNDHEEKIQNMSRELNYTQKTHMLCSLRQGNYTIKIRPKDKFYDDSDKCLCYYGNDTIRAMCVACQKYIKTIHIGHYGGSLTTGDDDSTVQMVIAPIFGSMAVILILVLAWFVVYKRKQQPCIRWSDVTTVSYSENQSQAAGRSIMYLIYTCDHEAHENVVEAFANLLRAQTDFNITLLNENTNHVTLTDSISLEGSIPECPLEKADLICVIHSEWAHRLCSGERSGTIYIENISEADDKNFISAIHEIRQNATYSSKTISVHFSYTSESFIIRDPFMVPMFAIPSNFEAFIKHIHTRIKNGHVKLNCVTSEEKKACLDASISSSFIYQGRNKSWLYKKLFNLHNSVSSDDSGIAMPKSGWSHRRYVRSRSVDTISCQVCKCAESNRQHMCSTCCVKQLPMSRTHSCDFSFSPPESARDNTSLRYSSIENNFIAINDRYDYVLNYKLNSDDDCITIYGKSV